MDLFNNRRGDAFPIDVHAEVLFGPFKDFGHMEGFIGFLQYVVCNTYLRRTFFTRSFLYLLSCFTEECPDGVELVFKD